MVVEGPFSQSWLEKKKQPCNFYSSGSTRSVSAIQNYNFFNLSGSSPLLLISLFELCLFNKLVIKEVKSGTIMEQIQLLFDYLTANEQLIYRLIDEYYEKIDHLERQIYDSEDVEMASDNENN